MLLRHRKAITGTNLHFRLFCRRSYKPGRDNRLFLHTSYITAANNNVHCGAAWRWNCRCSSALWVRTFGIFSTRLNICCTSVITLHERRLPVEVLCTNTRTTEKIFYTKKTSKRSRMRHKKQRQVVLKYFWVQFFVRRRFDML